jgi:hypothetical protein
MLFYFAAEDLFAEGDLRNLFSVAVQYFYVHYRSP